MSAVKVPKKLLRIFLTCCVPISETPPSARRSGGASLLRREVAERAEGELFRLAERRGWLLDGHGRGHVLDESRCDLTVALAEAVRAPGDVGLSEIVGMQPDQVSIQNILDLQQWARTMVAALAAVEA